MVGDRAGEEVEAEIGVLRREGGALLDGMVGECMMSTSHHIGTERERGVVVPDGVQAREVTEVAVGVGVGTEAQEGVRRRGEEVGIVRHGEVDEEGEVRATAATIRGAAVEVSLEIGDDENDK